MYKKIQLLCFICFLFFTVNVYSYEIKTYNGLKYCFYQVKDSDIGIINVKIRAGSIFDTKSKFGTAYILAAMLKKGGTVKYPTDLLFDKLDESGMELYSRATKDFINLSIKFIASDAKKAFDIFTQVLFHPLFNKKEFESVIDETFERIISYQNNNDYVAIHQGVLGLVRNQEYAHSSFGKKSDIKNITINDVKKFYRKYFCNNNMVITFAGNINPQLIDDFLKKNFNKNSCNERFQEVYPEFHSKSKTIFKEKNLKQSYIYFLFPSFGMKDKDIYSLKTLSFILGGNLTSILAEKIRKEKGLAYSVFSTNFSMMNGGFFVIGMQTENRKAEEAIASVIKILKELTVKGVTESQTEYAKKFLIGKIPVSLQSLNSIADYFSESIFLNKTLPPWEFDTNKYKEVNKNSINKVIGRIFNMKKMVVSIVGKSGEQKK